MCAWGTFKIFLAPETGEVVALDQVSNEYFACKVVGDSLAIRPTDKIIMASVNGTIVKIFNTNYVFCLQINKGVEIVVHMSTDTVVLHGQGFKCLVERALR